MSLSIKLEASVAQISLNRPEVRNAFNDTVIGDLTQTFRRLGQDPDVHAVVLSGEGPHFCTGGDLNWMQAAADYSERENKEDAQRLSDMLATMDACPVPVFTAVQGAAMGGGVGLLACSDSVIASRDAFFALSEVKLGLTPATISPFVIRAIGDRWARRLFTTAEKFDSDHALTIGLVHEVVEGAGDALARATALARMAAANAPGAVRAAKALVADFGGRPITDQLRTDTAERIALQRATAEGREGLSAFLSKRKPDWTRGSRS